MVWGRLLALHYGVQLSPVFKRPFPIQEWQQQSFTRDVNIVMGHGLAGLAQWIHFDAVYSLDRRRDAIERDGSDAHDDPPRIAARDEIAVGHVAHVPTLGVRLLPPRELGGAKVTTSCFPKRGRAVDLRTQTGKFDHNGNWAHAFKIPGQRDCTFDYVVATLNGTYRQPANMPIDMITNLQSLPANAQPRCYSKFFTCLQHARFRVSVNWRDAQGSGRAIGMATNDTSAKFYFFNADDTEMVVKVLDACDNPAFNSFWVFAGAATNVGYTLRVTDTQTGQTRTWGNPLGNDAAAIRDPQAFATCP